ncbi:MAG: ComEC/Rec2 family competence protein, partial [Patescibacteria group bacterium]
MGTREKIKTIVARFSVATPTPSKAFFLVCVAMLFGAMLGLWVIGFSFISYVIAWSSVIGFVCALYKWPRWALFFAVAAAFSFGFVRSSVARQMADPLLPFADGIVHIVSGIVYQPPQAQRRSVRFSIQTFSVDGIRQSAMLTVVAEPFPVIRAGDVLELRCTFTDEMKGRRPVAPVCLFPDVDIVRHESIGWRGILPAARDGVAERIDEAFPEPVAGFVRGLLLGGSTRLPEILREALLTTGTVHLVALSGFNITIIAA